MVRNIKLNDLTTRNIFTPLSPALQDFTSQQNISSVVNQQARSCMSRGPQEHTCTCFDCQVHVHFNIAVQLVSANNKLVIDIFHFNAKLNEGTACSRLNLLVKPSFSWFTPSWFGLESNNIIYERKNVYVGQNKVPDS